MTPFYISSQDIFWWIHFIAFSSGFGSFQIVFIYFFLLFVFHGRCLWWTCCTFMSCWNHSLTGFIAYTLICITYIFFYLGFIACQDYFTHFEQSQSIDGAKMGNPWEKLPDHPQAEHGLSHMWPELGSTLQWWDDEGFRVLKISGLNHSATMYFKRKLLSNLGFVFCIFYFHLWTKSYLWGTLSFLASWIYSLYKKKMMFTQRRLRSAWASTQSDQSLHCQQDEKLGP